MQVHILLQTLADGAHVFISHRGLACYAVSLCVPCPEAWLNRLVFAEHPASI